MWCVFLLCSDPSHGVAPMLSAGSKTREPRQRHNATRDNGTKKAEKKGIQDAVRKVIRRNLRVKGSYL